MERAQMVDRFGRVAGKRLRVKRRCSAFDTACVDQMLDPLGEGDVRGALSAAHRCDCLLFATLIEECGIC
jgi:hypothetical protein